MPVLEVVPPSSTRASQDSNDRQGIWRRGLRPRGPALKLDDIESAKPSRRSLWIHPNELLASRICTFLTHLLLSVPSAFMIIVAICAIYYLQDYHDFAIILFFVIGNAALCVFEEEVNAINVMSESESSTGIYNTSVTPMSEVIEKAADLLPHQPIIANFVHHNPWERFQHMPFFDALEHVSRLSAYMSPAERLYSLTLADPRLCANEAVAELAAIFLDLGAAKWAAPNRQHGFVYFFASLEGFGLAPWRGLARYYARGILDLGPQAAVSSPRTSGQPTLAERLIQENLDAMGVPVEERISALRAILLDLPGWAGMFLRMEHVPCEAPEGVPVRLADFAAVYTTLQRASLETSALLAGQGCYPMSTFLKNAPKTRRTDRSIFGAGAALSTTWRDLDRTLSNSSAVAASEQIARAWPLPLTRQTHAGLEKLEDEYERIMLNTINNNTLTSPASAQAARYPTDGTTPPPKERPSLMFYTCFDERECSFRRYIEACATSANEIETFGVPGFFHLAIRHYKACPGSKEWISAPEGSVPPAGHIMKEVEKNPKHTARARLAARLRWLFETWSLNPFTSLVCGASLSVCNLVHLWMVSCLPTARHKLADMCMECFVPPSETDFSIPFTPEEAAARLKQMFHNIGIRQHFAPLVTALAHGSRSVNNPFDAAYNCGACGGREGGANARLFARCANDPAIRQALDEKFGIVIPSDTWFVGGYHDTTSDLVELYDLEAVPATHKQALERAIAILENSRCKNALERSAKFINIVGFGTEQISTPAQAIAHVKTRSVDIGQARPELGHATNASIVLGRRVLTKGCFLDRRPFLPSYDPFNDDDRGSNLETILAPALIVASGINLEYLFSTISGGAGTKAPMNLVGHFGVSQGSAGDLLVGLPTQMGEWHTPVRALYVIDAPVSRVEEVLKRRKELANLVYNDWVRMVIRDPISKDFYRQEDGSFKLLSPDAYDLPPGAATQTVSGSTTHTTHTAKLVYPPTTGKVEHVSPAPQMNWYGRLAIKELTYTLLCMAGAIVSCAGPMGMTFQEARPPMLAAAPAVSACATAITLCVLVFSHRYLTGETMFGRFATLSTMMLVGFNLVVSASDLHDMSLGWAVIGFASTFLIGAFSDRPTARDNATFAFLVYCLSDIGLLLAAAFALPNAYPSWYPTLSAGAMQAKLDHYPANSMDICAAGLVISALIKSSQFPVTGLLIRSMEGSSPNSAMGYAGISSHVGVVLLCGTLPLWFPLTWARALVGAVGGFTAIQSAFIAQVRADRKGGLAAATAGTIGTLFWILAASGIPELVLVLCLCHAGLRITQVLGAGNWLLEWNRLAGALGHQAVAPSLVPSVVYKLGWAFNRLHTDFNVPQGWVAWLDRPIIKLGWLSQMVISLGLTAVAFYTHLPAVAHGLSDQLRTDPSKGWIELCLHVCTTVALVRFVMGSVLDFRRFRPEGALCGAKANRGDYKSPVTTNAGSGVEGVTAESADSI